DHRGRGGRDVQPCRPAGRHARRARGPDDRPRRRLRGRQRQHRPHRGRAGGSHRPAAAGHAHAREPRRRRWLPPRRPAGPRRGLRPHLAHGRRRRARARLPGHAGGPPGPLPGGGPRGPLRSAGREGGGALRPAQPAGDPAEDGEHRLDVEPPRRHAPRGAGRERRLRGVHGRPRGGRRDRTAGPLVLHLLRRRRLRGARPAGRLPHRGGARRGPGAPARLRPAARPLGMEGVLHVPQPLRRPLPPRREPARPPQALPDRPGRRRAEPAARRPRRGGQRGAGAAVGPRDADGGAV
ncbi:MAG: Rhamnosyl transferase, partial [uncultured Nocardioides sp.]